MAKISKLTLKSLIVIALIFILTALPTLATPALHVPEDVRSIDTTKGATIIYGQLLGVGNATAPGSLNVRSGETDYIVYFSKNTIFSSGDDRQIDPTWFLPGDWLRVIGNLNPDGLSLDADVIINTSVRYVGTRNINGFIQSIDVEGNKATMEWNNKIYRLDFTPNSRLVVNRNFNASVSDLQVGDRVRGRGIAHPSLNIIQVRLMIVLRRGTLEWIRNNMEIARGTLLSINTTATDLPENVTAILELKRKDNDQAFSVYTTADTIYVRRFLGRTTLDEFLPGDFIAVVGRRSTNNSTVITARLIRDHSLRILTTRGIAGEITALDSTANRFTLTRLGVDWLVDFTDTTHIVLITPEGTINPAKFSDLQVGDTCRGRGFGHPALKIVNATKGVCWR